MSGKGMADFLNDFATNEELQHNLIKDPDKVLGDYPSLSSSEKESLKKSASTGSALERRLSKMRLMQRPTMF